MAPRSDQASGCELGEGGSREAQLMNDPWPHADSPNFVKSGRGPGAFKLEAFKELAHTSHDLYRGKEADDRGISRNGHTHPLIYMGGKEAEDLGLHTRISTHIP